MPFAVRLKESKMILPGTIESHEMEVGDNPILISQASQAAMGMVKDMRAGTVQMKDYDMQSLEIVRHARNGLFMVRIDHLLIQDYKHGERFARVSKETGEAMRALVIDNHVSQSGYDDIVRRSKIAEKAGIPPYANASFTAMR